MPHLTTALHITASDPVSCGPRSKGRKRKKKKRAYSYSSYISLSHKVITNYNYSATPSALLLHNSWSCTITSYLHRISRLALLTYSDVGSAGGGIMPATVPYPPPFCRSACFSGSPLLMSQSRVYTLSTKQRRTTKGPVIKVLVSLPPFP
ncbi:hypothetical protein HDV62DRAFT_384743 [Trichoderma sp. SZMC 28011]